MHHTAKPQSHKPQSQNIIQGDDETRLAACCELQDIGNRIAKWLFLNGEHASGPSQANDSEQVEWNRVYSYRKDINPGKRFEASALYASSHWETLTAELSETSIVIGTEDGLVTEVQVFENGDPSDSKSFNSPKGLSFIAGMLELMFDSYMCEVA